MTKEENIKAYNNDVKVIMSLEEDWDRGMNYPYIPTRAYDEKDEKIMIGFRDFCEGVTDFFQKYNIYIRAIPNELFLGIYNEKIDINIFIDNDIDGMDIYVCVFDLEEVKRNNNVKLKKPSREFENLEDLYKYLIEML